MFAQNAAVLGEFNSKIHVWFYTAFYSRIKLTLRLFLVIILIRCGNNTQYKLGLTQIRVGLSKLNFHKFKHNFRDTVNPMCPTSDGIEDAEHFLLLCPSFDVQRQDLLAGIAELLRPVVQIADLSNDALTQLLLCGDNDLSNNLNRSILELTLSFIHETGRFD